jgi:peptidoglycan/LPS O-acetylase OafA/YrhL
LTGSQKIDFLAIQTKGQINLGEFAVGGFFAISGFLVTQSLLNSKSVLQYLWKRFLRLFPALFASLVFTAILLGPFITHLSMRDYFFGIEGVSPWQNIFSNITLSIFSFKYIIRDLFINNPYPYAVNGSLWTLKHEFASYIILILLSFFSFVKHPKLLLLFTGLIGSAYLVYHFLGVSLVSKITTTWWIFNSVEYPFFLEYFWMFLQGSILYIYRKNIFVNSRLFILFFGLVIISIWAGYFHYAWLFFSPYLIISTAIILPLSAFSKYGDFSYGIYVYAFPIQQTLVYLLYPNINEIQLMAYSFVIALIVAVISWKVIEKPALSLKSKVV